MSRVNSEGISLHSNLVNVKSRVDKVIREARIAGPATQRIAESVASRFGARVTPLNYKSPASIARKLKANPNKPVKDGARTTIIVSSDKIGDVVKALNGNPMKADYKEHKPKEMAGYSGHLFNFKNEDFRTKRSDNPKRRKGNASKIDSRNYYDNFRK